MIVPAPLELTLHVTAVLLEPVTPEVNCNDCYATRVAVVGEIVNATGFSVTIATAMVVSDAGRRKRSG